MMRDKDSDQPEVNIDIDMEEQEDGSHIGVFGHDWANYDQEAKKSFMEGLARHPDYTVNDNR
jgi:hypothetical protein